MTPMNYEWLGKLLTDNPKALRHYVIRDPENPNSERLVLTADTAELQKFVLKHLNTPDAWKESTTLKRNAAGAATAAR